MATRQPAPGPHRGGRRRISRTLVRGDDPAFAHPAKFAGPLYDEEQARALAAAHTWEIRRDGARWRRVVPSPEPAGLPDLPAIRTLLDCRAIVVCAGGGGVPVVARDGRATPPELKQRDFLAGSMGPKVDAACRFVEATGGPAAIGRLADARALLTGEAGTLVSW